MNENGCARFHERQKGYGKPDLLDKVRVFQEHPSALRYDVREKDPRHIGGCEPEDVRHADHRLVAEPHLEHEPEHKERKKRQRVCPKYPEERT